MAQQEWMRAWLRKCRRKRHTTRGYGSPPLPAWKPVTEESTKRRSRSSAPQQSQTCVCAGQLDAGAGLAEPEAAGELSAPQPAAALTVAEDIRRFLRRVGQATTKEIIAHVRNSRPWAGPRNIGPELSRLLAYGDIVRVRTGLYRPAAREEEYDAG
ncbi:hypothetical protein [Streptomyces demainii]|uniref:Uncharacterized protein n=1 Tax=Streptomyces demainii TaxID=588122 RepID=A0ABT9KWM2_9ACTN|nr:hypothetical protein [Streptomyces demainii]MDP9612838.1 hypothetical protein [Streptomyces demainii]